MSAGFRLNLLGVPRLQDECGDPIDFRVRKHLALLIYLALEGRKRPVPRSRLCELFWPDRDKRRQRHSLANGLTEIRRKLGKDSLQGYTTHLRLMVPLDTEIHAEALDSFEGTCVAPLEDLEVCGGGRFSLWVEATRDRILLQLRTRLSDDLQKARDDGGAGAVREKAERLYAVDPYNDFAMQSLVAARVSSGDWAGALRVFQLHGRNPDSDIGPAPLWEAKQALSRYQRAFLLPDRRQCGAKQLRAGQASIEPNVFVGREDELTLLKAMLDEFLHGGFRTCGLMGPDGIGKTSILKRFSLVVSAAKVTSFFVCCQEIGQNIPFAAVSDLLDQMTRDQDFGATDRMWLAEASRIAPGIRAAFTGIQEPPETPPETVRVRLAEAIKRILVAIADGKPIYLVFDEMHFMDQASRDVLHVLSRKLEDTAALIVSAARCSKAELQAGACDSLNGIVWDETICVRPLDDEQAASMVETLVGGDGKVHARTIASIVGMAQGNPLHVEMLVRDHVLSRDIDGHRPTMNAGRRDYTWSPSKAMSAVLERYHEGLNKGAIRLLNLLATAGRMLAIEDLPTLLTAPATAVDEAVLELLKRRIVVVEGSSLGFANDLHREYVADNLQGDVQKYLHAHLAQHLRAAKDGSRFQHAIEASFHFLQAEWLAEGRELACEGAIRAIEWGAPQEAEKALRAVVNLSPMAQDVDIAILLARACSAQGAYAQVVEVLRRIDTSEASSLQKAEAAYLSAEALQRGRLYDDLTIAMATRIAVQSASAVGSLSMVLKARQIAAEGAFESGDWQELDQIAVECKKLESESEADEPAGLAKRILGFHAMVRGKNDAAKRLFSEAAQLLGDECLHSETHKAYTGIGMSATRAGRHEEALDAFSQAGLAAVKAGDTVAHANAELNLASLANELGQFDRAAAHYLRAIELDKEMSSSRVSTAIYCNAANLSIAVGNFEEADDFLSTARRSASDSRLWQHGVSVCLTMADLFLAKGRHERAWDLVEQALRDTGERCDMVPDLGQYCRLRDHYYAENGAGMPRALIEEPESMSVSHSLERAAFVEWLSCEGDCHQRDVPAWNDLIQRRLFGILARLVSVGVRLPPFYREQVILTSAADLVARSFPEHSFESIPNAVMDRGVMPSS